jgi:hypothetical protein
MSDAEFVIDRNAVRRQNVQVTFVVGTRVVNEIVLPPKEDPAEPGHDCAHNEKCAA